MWSEEFKDKNGATKHRFYERYIDPLTNKRKRTSVVMNKGTRQSEKEAQRLLNKKIDELIKKDKLYVAGADTLTFVELTEEWFSIYKIQSGSKQSTINAKQSKINTIKNNIPTDILANNLNSSVFQNFINYFVEKNYSQDVIRDYFSIIRNILQFGKKKYKLNDISYLEDVIIPKKALSREAVKAKRENYLEYHQIQKIIESINELSENKRTGYQRHAYKMGAFITEFQALNGMRIGELLAIQAENIDFKNKKLTIDGTILWERNRLEYGFKDTTKNESSYRTISITTRSIEILKSVILENKKLKQWESNYQDRGFLFVDYKGNPISKSTINRLLKNGAKEVGIEKNITTHTLRHSHISLLSQLGVSLRAIMDRVGHSDHKTTLQIYSHVTEQMDKDMMDKLENIY